MRYLIQGTSFLFTVAALLLAPPLAPAGDVNTCSLTGAWRGEIAVVGGMLDVGMAGSGFTQARLEESAGSVTGVLSGPGFTASVAGRRQGNRLDTSSWVSTGHGSGSLPFTMTLVSCDRLVGELERSPFKLERVR